MPLRWQKAANVAFLSNLTEWVVTGQLQGFLNEAADSLDLFSHLIQGLVMGLKHPLLAWWITHAGRWTGECGYNNPPRPFSGFWYRHSGSGPVVIPVLLWGWVSACGAGDCCSVPWFMEFDKVPSCPHTFWYLCKVAQRFGRSCHQYGDDAQLYLMLPADLREAVEIMKR